MDCSGVGTQLRSLMVRACVILTHSYTLTHTHVYVRTLILPMHFHVCTHSLRALFGTDKMQNAVHGSSNKEKAEAVIKDFFEGVEFNPDGTIKAEDTGECIMYVGGNHGCSVVECELCMRGDTTLESDGLVQGLLDHYCL